MKHTLRRLAVTLVVALMAVTFVAGASLAQQAAAPAPAADQTQVAPAKPAEDSAMKPAKKSSKKKAKPAKKAKKADKAEGEAKKQ